VHLTIHQISNVPDWKISVFDSDTILWTHAARFWFSAGPNSQSFKRITRYVDSIAFGPYCILPFGNVAAPAVKENCQTTYIAPPVRGAFHDSTIFIELRNNYQTIDVNMYDNSIKFMLGNEQKCDSIEYSTYGPEGCYAETVILIKPMGIERVSGISSDRSLQFDFIAKNDTLIAASKAGEWPCISL